MNFRLSRPTSMMLSRPRLASALRLVVAWLVLLMVGARKGDSHEVPARVAVQILARPDSTHLRLIVRVPLESLRDIDFPRWRDEYLDIGRATPLMHEAATLWIAGYLELYEGNRRLPAGEVEATRIALPSDRSLQGFDLALANVASPALSNDVELPWRQAMLDVVLSYPISSIESRFSVRPLLAHLGISTTTVMRWTSPDGSERVYEYVGNPGLVALDPGVLHAAGQFISLGFMHILSGIDHLLFLLCLVIPYRRLRPLVGVVTAFTAAHSLTLIASALGMAPSEAWFPPLIEVLIAASIVAMALENILGARLERRWLVAFAFGLVHGFGFSFALRESMQFAGRHLITSLLSFNVGVEFGQLLVLVLTLPVLGWLFRRVGTERPLTIVLSAVVAHQAWHWMTARFAVLRAYDITWPALDMTLAAAALRLLLLALITVALLWGVAALVSRLSKGAVQRAGWTLAFAGCMLVAGAPRVFAQSAGAVRSTLSGVFTEAQAARGKDIYVGTCRECHTPASHTGVVFRNSWGGKLLSDLLEFMQEKMPKNSPGSLTGEEYAAVTAYILMLNGLPAGDNELPSDTMAARRIRIETVTR